CRHATPSCGDVPSASSPPRPAPRRPTWPPRSTPPGATPRSPLSACLPTSTPPRPPVASPPPVDMYVRPSPNETQTMPAEIVRSEIAEQPEALAQMTRRWDDLVATVARVLPSQPRGVGLVARGSSDYAAVHAR